MPDVLIAYPCKPDDSEDKFRGDTPATITALFNERLNALMQATRLNVQTYQEGRAFPQLATDSRPWSKITRIRNNMLDNMPWELYDYVLWIDADIVDFPPDLIENLIDANPTGVSAPMVLTEDTNGFYDRSAFIIKGTSDICPQNRSFLTGRNLTFIPPYWLQEPQDNIVEMDCVGSVLLVNTDIYDAGARYTDHPAFTDHFAICSAARAMKRPVTVRRDMLTYHANLPKYGKKWH